MKINKALSVLIVSLVICLSLAVFAGCSSGPEVKQQGYAHLSNSKDFEEEYPIVWKASLAALEDYKIIDKDEEDGTIETDWVYTTSNEKYFEYQVNGFPRKKYFQTRYKIKIKLEKQLGSIKVTANLDQELERLKSDGSSDGWKAETDIDSSRANEIIKNIERKITSRPTAS